MSSSDEFFLFLLIWCPRAKKDVQNLLLSLYPSAFEKILDRPMEGYILAIWYPKSLKKEHKSCRCVPSPSCFESWTEKEEKTACLFSSLVPPT
jgi:hypothetical protein